MALFKRYLIGAILLAGLVVGVKAFTPGGPFKTWQLTPIGYDLPGDIAGPMTLGEAYRWNVPDVYYAFDQSFIAYFGTEGMDAIEEAMGILNGLPPASEITNDSSSLYINGQRVPTDTRRINFQAQASGLLDLKSHALSLLLEELGLTTPERYVWTLRGRDVISFGGTMFTNYTVVKLNYDPVTLQPSSFINDVQYSYRIFDPIPTINYADAVEFSVDPLAFSFSSVAGAFLTAGEYFTGLTKDDVGGIRFLLTPNNLVNETLLPNTSEDLFSATSNLSPWVPLNTLSNFLSNTNISSLPPGITNLAGSINATNFVVDALRPGVDKINFIRSNYDSLIGINFITVTNRYQDNFISNSIPLSQPLQRTINAPDILFVSADLGLGGNLIPVRQGRTGTATWINNDALNGVVGAGGPGQITPGIAIAFTDQLPFFDNGSPFFLDESTALAGSGVWATFDGTTNAPIIYPRYLDITLDDILAITSGGGN